MLRRSIVALVVIMGIAGSAGPAQGAEQQTRTASVDEAAITVSYPAGWVTVPYDMAVDDFDTVLAEMQAQDPHVTARQLHAWLDAAESANALFYATDRRSGDNVLVVVREDDFDDSFYEPTVAQLEHDVKAELRSSGLKLASHVKRSSIGDQVTYRWASSYSGYRSTNLYLAHPQTNATVAVAVTTDDNAKGARVAAAIMDSVRLQA